MSRRVTWILLLAILLAPVLGTIGVSAQPAAAQEEIVSDSTDPSDQTGGTDSTSQTDQTEQTDPTEEPTEPTDPTAEPTGTDVASPEPTGTDVPTPTDVPTETPTDVSTETPTETATATEAPTETATPTEDAIVEPAGVTTTADIVVTTLNCTAAVESFRVTNNGMANATITGIETLANKNAGEPYTLARILKPGQTGLFQAGPGAQYGTVITQDEIFTNSAYDADGVVLHMSTGSVATNDLETFDVTQTCAAAPKIDPWVANPGKLSDLKITLSCGTYTESIRVENKGTGYILLKGIATYVDPIADEPFSLNRLLKPGQGALYQAGAGATYGTVLTKRYIFTNSAWEKDGVRVATSVGKAFKACDPRPVPPEHWVEIDLSSQYLWAWEGNKLVNQTYVSTGKAGFETPTGTFYVNTKYRSQTMEGTIGGEYYYVPDVPWVMYFTNVGHALHGAYWHNDFGNPRSHGCVNLPLPFAEWLYSWLPYGGRVVIHW